MSDPSPGAGARASKTQAGKHKAIATPTLQKKAKKVVGKSTNIIKINEPTPRASPTPTPPSGTQKSIPSPIKQVCSTATSFIFKQILICSSLRRVPQDINSDASAQDAQTGGESLKVDKPLTPSAEKTAPKSSKPLSPSGMQGSPGTGSALSPLPKAASSLKPANQRLTESPETAPPIP
jgi:hypothetical protein